MNKDDEAYKKAQKAAALLGITQEEFDSTYQPISEKEERSREADSVLLYSLYGGKGFTQRRCRRCNKDFAVSYASVAYCSDTCRKAALAEIGIDWDINKPIQERWGRRLLPEGTQEYHVPLIVPQEVLPLLDASSIQDQSVKEPPVVIESSRPTLQAARELLQSLGRKS